MHVEFILPTSRAGHGALHIYLLVLFAKQIMRHGDAAISDAS